MHTVTQTPNEFSWLLQSDDECLLSSCTWCTRCALCNGGGGGGRVQIILALIIHHFFASFRFCLLKILHENVKYQMNDKEELRETEKYLQSDVSKEILLEPVLYYRRATSSLLWYFHTSTIRLLSSDERV